MFHGYQALFPISCFSSLYKPRWMPNWKICRTIDFFSRFGSATAVIMVAFSLSNKGFDSNRSHSGMIPMLDIEERRIRPPHSLSGSTTASIAEQPEDEEGSLKAKLRRYWLSDIDRDWTDILLIICGYISGLVEGLSFNYWGSFSNMQTGIFPNQTNPLNYPKYDLT